MICYALASGSISFELTRLDGFAGIGARTIRTRSTAIRVPCNMLRNIFHVLHAFRDEYSSDRGLT